MDMLTFREALYNKALDSTMQEENILIEFLENIDDNELKIIVNNIVEIYKMLDTINSLNYASNKQILEELFNRITNLENNQRREY